MAVIKCAQSSRLIKEALVLDLGDLNRQAKNILDEARRQAQQFITEAQIEARRLTESARDGGFKEGFDKGKQDGIAAGQNEGRDQARLEWNERLAKLSQSWSEALAKWEGDRAAMLHEAREDVIQFAGQVAEKVVRRSLAMDSTIARDQVVEAVKLIGRSSAVEVRIHPSDRSCVDENLAKIVSEITRCADVKIRDDESLTPGGCIVSTSGGRIDATIETQLARIAEALLPERSAAA